MSIGAFEITQLDVTAGCYSGQVYFTQRTDLAIAAAGGVFDVLIRPATIQPRLAMYWNTAMDKDGRTAVYENPTTSADGTEVFPGNLDRSLSTLNVKAPGNQVFENPTVTDPGDLLVELPIDPAQETGRGVAVGKTDALVTPVIFAPGVDYLVRLTNDDATLTAQGFIRLFLQTVTINNSDQS